MAANRETTSNSVAEDVDERNKAIDILIKALFMVCERFNRFKKTPLCMAIKAQPDVNEPDRYATKAPNDAKDETDDTHGDGSRFQELWDAQEIKDARVVGVLCPETPNDCPQANKSGIKEINNVRITAPDSAKYDQKTEASVGKCAERCGDNKDCQAFSYNKNDQVCDLFNSAGTQEESNDFISGVKGAETAESYEGGDEVDELQLLQLEEDANDLDQGERDAVKELKALSESRIADKYLMPINELLIAVQQGEEATDSKRKTIVTILIEIIEETRTEQAGAKQTHQDNLDNWYDSSWMSWIQLKNQMDEQANLHSNWRRHGELIAERITENNDLIVLIENTIKERNIVQKNINEDVRLWGVNTALRDEDQENIVKLRSLLRALYDAKVPEGCPKTAGVTCTDPVAGTCVFTERVGRTMRCSCEVGFYGNACQLKMCPGSGDVLYRHDQMGVCSNDAVETRGEGGTENSGCDNRVGECTCAADFYHGPENKCEYRHAPPSKYKEDGQGYLAKQGTIDEQCSGHGTVDKITGVCTCQKGYWGEAPNAIQVNGACEEKKCPGGGSSNSAGLTFPRVDTNACNGHGACVPEDGTCVCIDPYFGDMCEREKCPRDCNDGKHGTCDSSTGLCACNQKPIEFSGPSCMFRKCPGDCGRPQGGECDRNDGKCICKMGYTGAACERTSRCTVESLNTETNWYTIWDKPGWIACPTGQLLYEIKRRGAKCNALSCIDTGKCAAACQGDSFVYQIRHCYHDLGWYNSFDQEGWSKCNMDYFVAGLYRTCESLYCLQIAKCCSLKEGRYAGAPNECKEVAWSSEFKETGLGSIGQTGIHAFITGFYRGKGHDLTSLTKASFCEVVRKY